MGGAKVRIVGTDVQPFSAGLFRCDRGYLVPPANSKDWLNRVIMICRDEQIDAILIGSHPEILAFSRHKEKIEKKSRTKVIVNSFPIVDTFNDKWKTVRFLKKHNLDHPVSVLNDADSIARLIRTTGFPLVVKPRKGASSKNVFIVSGKRELDSALGVVPDPVIQKYIEGEEYTSGVFFDKESNIRGIITMKRDLCFGTTYRSIVDDFPEINDNVRKFGEVLGGHGAIGSINVQSRFMDGKLYIFEVNPRFSGTTGVRSLFRFNEPDAVIRNFLLGEEIKDFRHTKGIAMRYWEEVYTTLEEGDRIIRDGFITHSKSKIRRVF